MEKWVYIFLKNRTTGIILRFLIGFIFFLSGFFKITDLSKFQEAIYKLALVYDIVFPAISIIIPIMELVLSLALLLNIKTKIASELLLYLTVFFTAVLVVKLAEGTEARCGCFGDLIDDKIGPFTIIRNIMLMIGLLIIFLQSLNPEFYLSSFKKVIKQLSYLTIFFFLAIQNVAFSIHNMELKNRVYLLLKDEILSIGEKVPAINVETLDGNAINLNFTENYKTIIFIMQYGCAPCSLNQSFWKIIYNKYNNSKAKIMGISLSNRVLTHNLIEEHNISYPVFIANDDKFSSTFKISSTPLTLIIDQNSNVEKIWKGLLKEKDLNTIINKL